MRGFKLTAAHDLALENNSFPTLDGIEAAGQEIKTRLLFFKGEWFLDARQGVPYFTEILAKGYTEARVKSIIRQTILSVPGIVDVPRVTLNVNRATREAAISWEARYQDGTVTEHPPLIIDL